MIGLLREGNVSEFFARARMLEPADLADVLALADDDERVEIAKLLPARPHRRSADRDAGPGARRGHPRGTDHRAAAEIVGELPDDDAADILGELEPEQQQRFSGGRARGAAHGRAAAGVRRGIRRQPDDRGHGHRRTRRDGARCAGEHPEAGGGRGGVRRGLRARPEPAARSWASSSWCWERRTARCGADAGARRHGGAGDGPGGSGATDGAVPTCPAFRWWTGRAASWAGSRSTTCPTWSRWRRRKTFCDSAVSPRPRISAPAGSEAVKTRLPCCWSTW